MDADLKSEVRFVQELLIWLFGRSYDAFQKRGYWTDDLETDRRVVTLLPPISDQGTLEKKLPTPNVQNALRHRSEGGFGNKFLFLEHLEWKGTGFPVVHLSWHLSEGALMMTIRHFLFFLDPNGQRRGVGFRLEPPHRDGGNGGGHHDYWHVQMISEFTKGVEKVRSILREPLVVPESQPAFPLPARNSTQLLLTLLVGLYGKKMAEEVCLEFRHLNPKRSLRQMGIEV